jgi:hypothetical protein
MKKKKPFYNNGRPNGMVVLNWHDTPEREFTFFAEAYHLVAKEAVAKLRKTPRFGLYGSPVDDFLAYPVVFLYRHSFELYMKAVILVAAPMLKIKGMKEINRENLLKTHSLDKLRQELERVFEAYGWEWDLGTPKFHTLEDFRNTISELHEVEQRIVCLQVPA